MERSAKRSAKHCPHPVQAVKDAFSDTRNTPKTLSKTCPSSVQAVSKLVQALIILSKLIKDTSKSIANYSILSSKLSVQLTFL